MICLRQRQLAVWRQEEGVRGNLGFPRYAGFLTTGESLASLELAQGGYRSSCLSHRQVSSYEVCGPHPGGHS